jgi:general secretion pathway protein D
VTSNQLGNILSTPNLLTLDNYQAKIVVGQNVPFVTGSFTTTATVATPTAGAVNPFQTIERKDVGLILKIKPQISEGSTIRLEISQELSDIASSLLTGASDLITNKRSIDTKVIVDDGATVVLGGLIQNTLNETTQGVPLLSEIPILGALFRFKSMEKKRTNLMIFLRPVIIRAPEDAYRVTVDRYEYLRGYTRGEGPERENIYDRLEPTPPPPPAPPPVRPAPPPSALPPSAPPQPQPAPGNP